MTAALRLRSAPACDPPYDDEHPPEWWGPAAVQPLLELPAPPAADRDPLRSAWRAPPEPKASAASTSAVTWFVNTCLEILNGYRPIGHVRMVAHPLAAPVVLEEMSQAVRRVRRAVRAAGGHQLVKLRIMRTCQPRPRVAELAVVVGLGSARRWALAFRLEQVHGRWLCTAASLL
jgi:hypothetical protein